MIYLDHAATTPVKPAVVEVICQELATEFANPSSIYQIGKQAKRKLQLARQRIGTHLGIEPKHLYFTSGATEANNWAIRSQAYGGRKASGGDEIIATAIEHPSVQAVLEQLSHEGFTIQYVYPNEADGLIRVEDFQALSTDQTIGWVAMSVNNELGSLLPYQALGQAAQDLGLWFHVDAVQQVGHLPLDFDQFYWTSLSFSAHKFNGPKGIGLLAYHQDYSKLNLRPLLYGGGQESQMRSGTENLPYILGMAKALDLVQADAEQFSQHYQTLGQHLLDCLDQAGLNYQVNGPQTAKVANIWNIYFERKVASQLLIQLDLKGTYLSAGSACSAGSLNPSHVLRAYYPHEAERWSHSVRISFGRSTTLEEIEALVTQLKEII